MERGYIEANQFLYFSDVDDVMATVNEDGSLRINASTFTTLQAATAAFTDADEASAGHAHWFTERNGRRVSIAQVLEKAKKEPKNGRPRYSSTHPLIPYSIDCPGVEGKIVMCQCPGIRERGRNGEFWIRDVKTDLERIAEWGVTAVVSLLEPQEALGVGVWDLEKQLNDSPFHYYTLPIPRYQIPRGPVLTLLHATLEHIVNHLKAGEHVVIFCDTDMGRAGMIAARVLMVLGMSSEESIEAVRSQYPSAIETSVQMRFI
jgi:protein-tyrosine phosphatase